MRSIGKNTKRKLLAWAIVYNPNKPLARETANQLKEILTHLDAKSQVIVKAPKNLRGFDAVATIGGDGTLLGCVPEAIKNGIPIIGVNLGKLGYLAVVERDMMEESFEEILKGKFIQTPHALLKLDLPDGTSHLALNDIVIKSAEYRLAELRVSIDGEHVTEYPCDGLIFATPTGSTAYNLSAGGPMLHLGADALVLTPICAHTLTQRSVVFSSRSRLVVEHGRRHSALHVNVDGRCVGECATLLPLKISTAKEKLLMLKKPQHTQFEVLRKKLAW